jgi:fatty-acid desaturase
MLEIVKTMKPSTSSAALNSLMNLVGNISYSAPPDPNADNNDSNPTHPPPSEVAGAGHARPPRWFPRGYSAQSGYDFKNEPNDMEKPLLIGGHYQHQSPHLHNHGPAGRNYSAGIGLSASNNDLNNSQYGQGRHESNDTHRYLTKTILNLNDFNESYMKNLRFFSFGTLFIYLFLCILIICLWFEFDFIDSAYFTVVTLATVGFGDFKPTTNAERIFVTAMILIGLAIASFLASSLSEVVYDHNERMTQQRNIRTEQQLHDAILRRRYRKKYVNQRRGFHRRNSHRAFSFDGNEEFFVVKSGVSGIRLHVPVSDCQKERDHKDLGHEHDHEEGHEGQEGAFSRCESEVEWYEVLQTANMLLIILLVYMHVFMCLSGVSTKWILLVSPLLALIYSTS